MQKESRSYIDRKKIIKNIWLTGAIVLPIILVVVVFVLYWENQQFRNDCVYELITGCTFSLCTICAVYIINRIIRKEDNEELYDRAISERILGLLKAKKDEFDNDGLMTMYDDKTVTEIIENSISHFSPKLAPYYSKYIKYNLGVLRGDFDYVVGVTSGGGDYYFIDQDLKYTRYFKPESDTIEMCCCFTFGNNTLDRYMSKNKCFFHEEIKLLGQISDIEKIIGTSELLDSTQKDKLDALMTELGLKMSLPEWNFKRYGDNNELVSVENIQGYNFDNIICEVHRGLDDTGIMKLEALIFRAVVPKKCLKEDKGLCIYRGRVECKYKSPKEGRFLCVFANTMIDKTRFEIRFDRTIIKNVRDDVDFIKFIASVDIPDIDYPIHKNKGVFETESTIFPRSGICVSWNV